MTKEKFEILETAEGFILHNPKCPFWGDGKTLENAAKDLIERLKDA